MLAKVWKKVLLAVCIIACIYNVMHKLVSRTSLEVQLKSSINDQSNLIDDSSRQQEKDSPVNKTNSVKLEKKQETETIELENDDTIVIIE